MSRAMTLIAAAALLALNACGAPTRVPGGVATGPHRVYIQTVQNSRPALAMITVPGGSLDFLPDAILSANATAAYSVTAQSGATVVRALDPTTLRERGAQSVKGSYALPAVDANPVPGGLSANGSWLVLADAPPADSGQVIPSGSRFAVVNTGLKQPARQFVLPGTFRYDAVDNAGASVYLLEYPGASSATYRVRRFDLGSGTLDPTVIVDKGEPTDPMTGVRLQDVYSPDGYWHLGLYGRGNGTSFLHALPMAANLPFAFCVDVPAKASDLMTQMSWSAAISANGSDLYLANEALDELLQMALPPADQFDAPRVLRRSALAQAVAIRLPGIADVQAKELPSRRLAISRDGKTLYLATTQGILVIDTTTFNVRTRWLQTTPFSSLVLSPDGAIFATTLTGTARLDQVDAATGNLVTEAQVPLTIIGLEGAT